MSGHSLKLTHCSYNEFWEKIDSLKSSVDIGQIITIFKQSERYFCFFLKDNSFNRNILVTQDFTKINKGHKENPASGEQIVNHLQSSQVGIKPATLSLVGTGEVTVSSSTPLLLLLW